MFCSSQVRPAVSTAVRSSTRHDARVTDVDRQRTAVLLGDAAAAGLLTLDELDDRMARTWAASTGGELAAVEADLPSVLRAERDRRETALQSRAAARASLGRHLRSYSVVMTLLVAIWLVVGLTAGAWYPWPVWPALGMGIGVVGHVRAASARPA